MDVVYSSGWLEQFGDDTNAPVFAPAIEAAEDLLVPTISILEVFKRVTQKRGHDDAVQAVAAMQQGTVVDVDPPLALLAARLGGVGFLPSAPSRVRQAYEERRESKNWAGTSSRSSGKAQTMILSKKRLFDLLLLGGVLSSVSAGPTHLPQSRPELIWSFDTEG